MLEANPRASRTVPLVSKVCDVQMARIATRADAGQDACAELKLARRTIPHFGVKEAVFPFDMMPGGGPAARARRCARPARCSAWRDSFGLAFFKAQEAAKPALPAEGTVLISVAEKTAARARGGARVREPRASAIRATRGTRGVPRRARRRRPSRSSSCTRAGRTSPTRSRTGEIQLVINTPVGRRASTTTPTSARRRSSYKVPYITTLPAALAAARGIAAFRQGGGGVTSLQEYHAAIKG